MCFSEDWEVNHIGGTPPPHFNYLGNGVSGLLCPGARAPTLDVQDSDKEIPLSPCNGMNVWGWGLTVHRCFFFIGESAGWNCFDFLLATRLGWLEGSLELCFSLHVSAGLLPFRASTSVVLISRPSALDLECSSKWSRGCIFWVWCRTLFHAAGETWTGKWQPLDRTHDD